MFIKLFKFISRLFNRKKSSSSEREIIFAPELIHSLDIKKIKMRYDSQGYLIMDRNAHQDDLHVMEMNAKEIFGISFSTEKNILCAPHISNDIEPIQVTHRRYQGPQLNAA